jgi:hypothetical protein
MKWSSTAAALLVLAVSAPVHADIYSDYQPDGDAPAAEGPEFSAPMPEDESVVKAATPSAEAGEEAAEPALEPIVDAPVESNYQDGYGPAPPSSYDGRGAYGAGGACGPCGSGGQGGHDHLHNCCEYMDPDAAHLWDDYCASRDKHHGWLAGLYCRCRCRRCCCCCPAPAPRPMFNGCGCKSHFAWTSSCGVGCRTCTPICEKCAAPCGCPKSGGLLTKFTGWMHNRGDCCVADDGPGGMANEGWSEGEVYEYDSDPEATPLPPPPEVPADPPAESEAAGEKSARRGLFPEVFRLFPIGR